MPRTVLVAGASGFVGTPLCRALVAEGYDVRALTRQPESYDGAGQAYAGDVSDPATLAEAMAGVEAAYYLVHSLDSADFVEQDAVGARNFAAAAGAAGVSQIIYLGGLGRDSDELSPHLRSRRQVEHLLGQTGVPVTTLRAAVVVGHGGISWEITRQLVDHLPVMITPSWVDTRTHPIAIVDVVRYLVGVLGQQAALGRTFEVGGADILRYYDMMERAAAVQGKSLRRLRVPLLTPRLSSYWLTFVTDVDLATARNLIDSMTNEMVATENSIAAVVPGAPLGYDDAVRQALAQRAAALAAPTPAPR